MPPTQLRHRAKGYQKITAGSVGSSLLETPPSPTSCDSTTVPTVWCVFYASELKITTHRRLQIIEHAQAGQKQKSAHDSLHWSREGQDRTSTAALKKPNSYAISPVVTALCYLRTAVFSNAKWFQPKQANASQTPERTTSKIPLTAASPSRMFLTARKMRRASHAPHIYVCRKHRRCVDTK